MLAMLAMFAVMATDLPIDQLQPWLIGCAAATAT